MRITFSPFRFDPDKEIESLEKQEEEEKKKKQEKSKGMNKSAVPSNLDLKGRCALSPNLKLSGLRTDQLVVWLTDCLSVCLSVCLAIWPLIYVYHLLSVSHVYQLFI